MNVDNQILMGIYAGHVPDKDTLGLILDQFVPTHIGLSVQNVVEDDKTKEKVPDLAVIREDAANLNLASLTEFFENSKAWPRTAYFGKLDEKFGAQNIQPFCILDGNGQPFMSFFLEGTLNNCDEPVDHTEQYNYVNGILIPKVEELISDFADAEDFLDKLAAKLKKGGLIDKDFLREVGHRAVLQIMPVEGDIINLGKNDLHADYKWGWMSQRLVAKAKPAPVIEQAKAVVSAAANRFGFKKSATAASVPASPPPVPGPSEVKDAATKGSEDRYPAKPQNKDKEPELAARPPAWAKTNDDVKLWYKIIGNDPTGQLKTVLPAAWKRRLPIVVKNFEAVKIGNLEQFKAYALKRTLETSGTTAQTSSGSPPAETAAHDAAALSISSANPNTPIIGPKTMEKVLDFIAKNVDTSSKEIVGPKEIQDMEKALPKFSEEVGLSLDEIRNWPANQLVAIGNIDVMALVCYAIEWRAEARRLATGQPAAGKRVETEKSVTTTKQVGNTTIQESVAKPSGSRFGFRKAA